MRKPATILVCIIALCGAIGLVCSFLTPKEPTSQGRTLSQWLLTDRKSDNPLDLSESEHKAIRAMGTNALPHLLRMVSKKDSYAKLQLRAWVDRGSIIRRWTPTHQYERIRGAAGFKALGKDGAPAVPQLVELLKDGQTSYSAALALSAVGSPAVPALVQALTNESAWVRVGAVQAINFMHGAEEAIPDLLKSLDDPEPAVRGSAATALGDMRRQPQIVVPKLIESLNDTDSSVRASASGALALFGVEAHAAVPKLIELQQDADAEVRREAGAALKEVQAVSTKQ